jgi:hypothetical protein
MLRNDGMSELDNRTNVQKPNELGICLVSYRHKASYLIIFLDAVCKLKSSSCRENVRKTDHYLLHMLLLCSSLAVQWQLTAHFSKGQRRQISLPELCSAQTAGKTIGCL